MTLNKRLKPEYAEALLVYATTTEPLKSITDRLGLRYNTVCNYIRRNYPAVITQHKALFPKAEECFAEGIRLLQTTRLSPYQVMKQLDYGNRFLHYIRSHYPELQRQRTSNHTSGSRPKKVAKYAEAVAMLTELKQRQCNVLKYVAGKANVNYHVLRLHVYTYHRELIGLDPSKNKGQCSPRSAAKYANAIVILASEPKQPDNFILHVAEKLGLSYHALRSYIYVHHPELAQRKRRR